MTRIRFRDSLAARITGIFLLFLLVSTAAAAIAIREVIKRDLEQGTRNDLLRGRTLLETTLVRMRQEAALFAELGARAEQAGGRSQESAATAFQITIVEQSRTKGIRLESVGGGGKEDLLAGVLRRGFAGMPTADYVLGVDGPGRLHLVAVAPGGETRGDRKVVTATTSLGREFLRRESREIGGELTLLLRGEVLASSSACQTCLDCIRGILSRPADWMQLESGHTIYFTFDCRPDPQAVVAIPLRTFDGKTVAMTLSRSRENERKALFHTTLAVIGGGAGFIAAMAAAFLLLTRRVVQPLRDLTRAASAIAEGRYGEAVPVRGRDEVAELSTAFNRMSVSMEKAMREISDWNRLLETRVEDKTRQLEDVHLRMIEVERLAAMGQVAAGVAHELNNPLSGIMGYSELAQELFRGRGPESATPQEVAKMMGYFENICGLTRRCRDIILDMLKFARQPSEEFYRQSLNDLIEGTLAFLENQLRLANVTVVRECSGDLPPFQGNALQMQQVFTNVFMNAAQAMPDGGVITVRTRKAGDRLEAEFSDQGTGIPPEHLRRVFEPFFTTKPVGEGTGLGLSVSHSIVKRHGGEIAVASVVGKGTTFTVRLPVFQASPPVPEGGGRET